MRILLEMARECNSAGQIRHEKLVMGQLILGFEVQPLRLRPKPKTGRLARASPFPLFPLRFGLPDQFQAEFHVAAASVKNGFVEEC